MRAEELKRASQTAQVRMLAEELLSDGQVHSRKEIVDYVTEQGKKMGLDVFRTGHMAGGVREATINLECEKVGRATFQAKVPKAQGTERFTAEAKDADERAAEVCESAREQLALIAKDIDFVNADEAQMAQLMRLKACVQKLKSLEQEFRTRDDKI